MRTDTEKTLQQSHWQRIHAKLRDHLSRVNAELVLNRACTRAGLIPQTVQPHHLPLILDSLESALGLYLDRRQTRDALDAVRTLASETTRTPAGYNRLSVEISAEEHIDAARTAALRLAKVGGLGHVDAVKVATVVSELARNIYQYARTGTIRLEVIHAPCNGIRIVAEDSGRGIPHLDQVLSGQWRSKTGMGLGLLGSRRLMSTFNVHTVANQGTTIVTEKHG